MEVTDGVFGTWLGYSEQHDLLLHAGAQASDRLTTETGRGMTVLRGADGTVQWKNESLAYSDPAFCTMISSSPTQTLTANPLARFTFNRQT